MVNYLHENVAKKHNDTDTIDPNTAIVNITVEMFPIIQQLLSTIVEMAQSMLTHVNK